MNLTEKELQALVAIGDNGLDNMGGDVYADLLNDNYSYFNVYDIMRLTNLSRHQSSGLISSLDEKGLIYYDMDWALTEEGINTLMGIK